MLRKWRVHLAMDSHAKCQSFHLFLTVKPACWVRCFLCPTILSLSPWPKLWPGYKTKTETRIVLHRNFVIGCIIPSIYPDHLRAHLILFQGNDTVHSSLLSPCYIIRDNGDYHSWHTHTWVHGDNIEGDEADEQPTLKGWVHLNPTQWDGGGYYTIWHNTMLFLIKMGCRSA